MRAGRAVMCVNDDDSDDDGGDDKHHCEEHVFPYEWNSAGGGGDQLHNNQQEDSQRQQDRDGESHLFAWRQRDGHKDRHSGYVYTAGLYAKLQISASIAYYICHSPYSADLNLSYIASAIFFGPSPHIAF